MKLENDNKSNSLSARKYDVTGKVQTRIETLFTENETSRVIELTELSNERSDIEVLKFEQTSDALVEVLSADLAFVIDMLRLRLNEQGTIESIVNMDEIWKTWETGKPELTEKYAEIPDFDAACQTYADNLKNEEKLISSIQNKGIYGLFFPQIKRFFYGKIPNRFARRRVIAQYALLRDLPILERIDINKTDKGFAAQIEGELDVENFDYEDFLHLSRQMFGGQINAEDIRFESTETYILDSQTLFRISGKQHHLFEIKGSYFREEKQQFEMKDE